MGPDPEGIHGIDGAFARRAKRKLHVQGREAAVGDPVDLVLEALDVLGLLRKLVLWDEEREEGLLVVPVEEQAEQVVDVSPEREPERVPDVEALDRVADIHDLRPPQELVVPCREVTLGGEGPLIFLGQKTHLKLSHVGFPA
ncbi:MAG: hypothetical protein A4E39_00001 [Methanoregulaceae archaeon PtaB.Bin152]|nr:MAG: hypothetical protein A4E39_00001 [Methanoregulaceae archaeon PtaB.Bin152]